MHYHNEYSHAFRVYVYASAYQAIELNSMLSSQFKRPFLNVKIK